jgi:hypothetical protein
MERTTRSFLKRAKREARKSAVLRTHTPTVALAGILRRVISEASEFARVSKSEKVITSSEEMMAGDVGWSRAESPRRSYSVRLAGAESIG